MLFFDIETDGLLDTLSKIHCMTIIDEKDSVQRYRPNEIQNGIKRLLQSDYVCGHNVIAFDIPAIEQLYGVNFDREKVIDTLVLARLVYSNIGDVDNGLIRKGILPKSLWGRHSLKAYGYRLGELKGTYAEETEDCWAVFTEEMLEYNVQDVVVTKKLYEKLKEKGFTEHATTIEHKAQWLCQKMEHNGFPFDLPKALKLLETLEHEYSIVSEKLTQLAPPIPDRVFIPKRDNKTKGYKEGVPIQRYKEYNPKSRQQLKYILEEHYKYNFSDAMYDIETDEEGKEVSRKLKLDEETLKLIASDKNASGDVKLIADLYRQSFMLVKRLGQLAEGNNAWLKLVKDDLCIHGKINPNGAVSGRATHSSPNIAQVPAVSAQYGNECRELFHVPNGWYQAGVDCSGLELRCLAHYLFPYDNGEYAHEILNGDIHTANQKNAGLETRNQAKTFIYGFLYGAGNAKIGEIVNGTEADGKRLKEKFLKNTPAIKKLQTSIKNTLAPFNRQEQKRKWKRRYLIGLDGRKLHVRSLHSALNLLLQSAGALICKRWISRTEERLIAKGLTNGWDGDFVMMAWVHDEQQTACRTEEIAKIVVEESQKAVRDVQKEFNFRVQLDTEGKIGKNWADCH